MSQPPHPLVRLIKKGDYITRFERWIQQHHDDDIRQITGKFNCEVYGILKLSVRYHRKKIFEYLISNVFSPNHIINTNSRQTILHHVVGKNKDDFVDFLLKKGAEPNVTNMYGNTPIMLTRYHMCNDNIKTINIINHLIKYGANLNEQDNTYGDTVLHSAVSYDNVPIVKILLDNNADKEINNDNSKKAFCLNGNHPKLTIYAIQNNIPFDTDPRILKSMFNRYVFWGEPEVLQILIDNNYVDIDDENKTINGHDLKHYMDLNRGFSNRRTIEKRTLTIKLIQDIFYNFESKSLSLEQLCFAKCIASDQDMKHVPNYIKEKGTEWLTNYDAVISRTPTIISGAQLYLTLELTDEM